MAAGRHNLTRRALLGAVVGASALPGAVGAAPGPPAAGGGRAANALRAWERALAALRRSEARLDAHCAYEAGLPAPMRALPLCEPLEERFNDLASGRHDALRRLLLMPAPDLRSLSLKIDVIADEAAATLDDAEPGLAVLKADARRLAFGTAPARVA